MVNSLDKSDDAHATREAHALLRTSSAPELAKHVAPPVENSSGNRESLAKQLGFASYLELFEASTPLESEPANTSHLRWCITNNGPDQWVVWNDQDLVVGGTFSSRDDAAAAAKKWSPT